MRPLLLLRRSPPRLARPSSCITNPTRIPGIVRPYAQQSYGGDEMSGHPKSDQANPKADLEHPGPESPASKGTISSSRKDEPSSSSSSSSKPEQGTSKSSQGTSSRGGSPAIHNPGPAPETADEGVRKHNDEVAKRHDRPVNQIDSDGKVEKGFWSGQFSLSSVSSLFRWQQG